MILFRFRFGCCSSIFSSSLSLAGGCSPVCSARNTLSRSILSFLSLSSLNSARSFRFKAVKSSRLNCFPPVISLVLRSLHVGELRLNVPFPHIPLRHISTPSASLVTLTDRVAGHHSPTYGFGAVGLVMRDL